eukprot:Nitzschia sp. Nitz4//scaffold5_size260463//37246//41143//NITZ4_000947-RA/size260463-processed-gene-0.53-mRNA-1//1//CDS//3329555235//4014//frame0
MSPEHDPPQTTFPSIDLVPKKESNALELINTYPDYDGSNVLIGILDTGIDPGAAGIRFMEDGVTPKLLDLVDCTGSGDVDIKTTKTVSSDYTVKVLSGATVQLNPEWWEETSSTSSELPTVRLGLKLAYELFPASVTTRVKEHRARQMEQNLQGFVADIRSQLAEFREKYPKPTAEQLLMRDDLNARLEVLTDKEWEAENDPGMIIDCIVFNDGKTQRAVLGVVQDEGCDWKSKRPLAAFSIHREYGTLSAVDQYNFGVNFYDNNTILSIVGDCTPHGTHVAAIAAAAQGPRSGIAKGAQLVSIKIGDSRKGSMESGTSIVRGVMTAIRLGCDVINLSYGEATQLPNAGRIIRAAEELVWRHNILFVSAVGNDGPALSTVNALGGTSSCIIGVAAHVSPEMMKASYSLETNMDTEGLLGTTYTWSSVGPTTDGSLGVCICAPGGAITSVSNWTLQKSMLMNGTSMASPHACGCIALLISACKAQGIPVSQPRIQRALENTALHMEHLSPLQQGWGMLQVDKALEHLIATKENLEDINFEVSVENRVGSPRGIYLRQPGETSTQQVFSVRVNPNFRRTDMNDEDTQKQRVDFELQCTLRATESWVTVPNFFMLMNNGRSFKVTIDPTQLPVGVHTAKVCGYDSDHPHRGILWYVPITVVRPIQGEHTIVEQGLEFSPTETKRFFVAPPPGTTWMDVTIRDDRGPHEEPTNRLVVLHAVQLTPHAAYRDNASRKYLQLRPSQTVVSSLSVEEGVTYEIAICRYWSTAGTTRLNLTIEMRGLQPIPSSISMASGDIFSLVRLQSTLKDELVSPAGKLTHWKTPIRPKGEGIITPLGERDVQPWNNKTIYQLVLTYEFTLDEKASFTPRAPALQEVLYESCYESQLMLVYDGDKKYLGFCDIYAQPISAPKGTVVIKMQIRHEAPTMLEKLKSMIIWIERKMEKEVSLSAFSTREDLLVGGKRTMKKHMLRKGSHESVFFGEPQASKIPNTAKPGDILTGSCTFAGGEASLPGDGKRPGGFKISYVVGPKEEAAPAEPEAPEPKDERGVEERLEEAIRDLKVAQLEKLSKQEKSSGKFDELYAQLLKEYIGHVPLLMARLKYLDSHKKRADMLGDIVGAADDVVKEISENELALHYGRKQDKNDPERVKRGKEIEKKKNSLVEALTRKAYAIADSSTERASSSFDETLTRLKVWVDIDSNGKYASLALERDCRNGKHGLALKRINKLISKNGKDTGGIKPMTRADLLDKRAKILKELGYDCLCQREGALRIANAPTDYKLF